MPAKKPAQSGTLAYLAECGRAVYIVCGKCSRFTVANFYKIAQSAGWRAEADQVGKRMRCTACGYRGAKFTTERPQVGRSVCPRCLRPYS